MSSCNTDSTVLVIFHFFLNSQSSGLQKWHGIQHDTTDEDHHTRNYETQSIVPMNILEITCKHSIELKSAQFGEEEKKLKYEENTLPANGIPRSEAVP